MKTLLALAGLLVSSLAQAHPVAFEGSFGIMGYHSAAMTDLELNYSVKHWLAPSLQYLRFTEGTSRPDVLLAKLNLLAKRWNGADYQGNIYLHGGYGQSRLSGRSRGAYHLGATGDAETRKVYGLAQLDLVRSSQGTEVLFWKARAGFAPYVASFEKLHSWLILEANRKSVGDRRVEIVPYLRFFYENVLWEVGASLQGELHFNYIIHI